MSTLYDLIDDYQRFSEILECEDTDEAIKDDLKEAVDNLADDIEAGIDNYGKAISNRKANIAARKAEIERLQALNDADNRAIDRMKGICEQAMRITGKPKVKTTFYNFYFQKNPESVVLEEGYIENIPEEFLIYQEPKVNKTAIKEALKGDDEALKERLEGIAHLEQTESIRIR
jgi:hypothetical protein